LIEGQDTFFAFKKAMNAKQTDPKNGSALLVAMGTILIISIVGAGVLMHASTRYNVTSKQVKGWKEALYAAEAGGDIAFAEVRKIVTNPGTQFTGTGWTSPKASTWKYSMPSGIGESGALTANVTVDRFTSVDGHGMYRIRSIGNARVFGLRRTGMDDTVTNFGANFTSGGPRGNGDSLLRKVDFSFDHFIATYGDGDGNGKASVPVPTDANGKPLAKVSRRIELISVPVLRISSGFTVGGSFRCGNGVIDSYDSKNGPYVFAANNPSSPYYADSRDGDVTCGSSDWRQGTEWIYGDVTTNGGNASPAKISGVVDNNVPIQPVTVKYPPVISPIKPSPLLPAIITPLQQASDYDSAPWYQFNSLANVTILNVTGAETYINVMVDGNLETTMNIAKGINVRFYFTGNLTIKGSGFLNNNVAGSPSTNPSRAGHVQFYGVSPTAPATQRIDLNPPGDLQALVYAPSADFYDQGNNQFFGALLCKNYYGNGSTAFHFDKQLATGGQPIDYRIASYIEDIR
jgi:hypothetical protein